MATSAMVSRRIWSLYGRGREPFWALMSQILTSGANFVSSVVIIRAAGLTEFGRFSIAYLILMTSRNFLNGMVLVPMSTYAPKLQENSAAAYRGFLLANGTAFALVAGLLLIGGTLVGGETLHLPWLSGLASSLALANVTANAADFFRRYQFATGRAFPAFLVDVVRFAVQLPVLVALAYGSSGYLDARLSLLAMAAGGAAAALFGAVWGGPIKWRRRLSASMWQRHTHFIKWMTPGVALEAVHGIGPMLLAAAILGETALGAIRAVQQLANLLNLPANAGQQVLPSMFAQVLASSGPRAVRAFFIKSLAVSGGFVFVISLPVIAAWPLLAERWLHLGWQSTMPILLASLGVCVFVALRTPMLAYLYVSEMPQKQTSSLLPGAIFALVCTGILAPLMGPEGVPLAILLGMVLTTAFTWYNLDRGRH